MDFYSLLGVDRKTNLEKIKVAFRELAFKYHPDKNPNPESIALFQRITKAYEILTDSEARKAYDAYLEHINSRRLFTNNTIKKVYDFTNKNEKSAATSFTKDAYQFSKVYKNIDDEYLVIRIKSMKNVKLDEVEIRKQINCTIPKIYFNANMTAAEIIICKDEKLSNLPNYNENFTIEICDKSKGRNGLENQFDFNSYEKKTLHRMRNICFG